MANKSKFTVKHGLAVNTQSGSTTTLNYPTADGTPNQFIKTNGNGTLVFDSSVSDFLNLTDTPSSYSGQNYKVIQVDSNGTGLMFGSAVWNSTERERYTASGDSNVITLTNTFAGQNDIMVFVDGVVQYPGTNFTLDSNVLTFTSAPDSAARIEIFGMTNGITQVPGSGTVTASKLVNPLVLPDNHKLAFGTGSDLQIYHDGLNNIISGTIDHITVDSASIPILSSATRFKQDIRVEDSAYIQGNLDVGSVLTVTGQSEFSDHINLVDHKRVRLGASNDLQLWHDNNGNSYIDNDTGQLHFRLDEGRFTTSNGAKSYMEFQYNTNTPYVNLFYNSNQKLATTDTGINVTGTVTNDGLIVDGEIDLVKNANSGPNYIDFKGTTFNLRNYNGNRYNKLLQAEDSAGVTLYHNDSSRFVTTTYGATVTGTLNADSATFTDNIRADGGNLIMGDDAFSTNAAYVGIKTSNQSGVNDYMIISGTSDGSTYVSAKSGATVNIRSGGNGSTAQLQIQATKAVFSGPVEFNNQSISQIHALAFNDPGPSEGISWTSGNMKIYESPNDLVANTAGNLQVTHGDVRRFTVSDSGAEVVGHFHADSVGTSAIKFDSAGSNFSLTTSSATFGSYNISATTTHGYMTFGPLNNSYCHITTDKDKFWFNKPIHIDGNLINAYDGDLLLQRIGVTKLTLTSTGADVSGALTATTKSFDIEHPTKEGMRLRYGSLEGPENGVYVRGKLENSNIIELPDYWTGLVDENTITVSLTPIGRYNEVWVDKIEDNKVYINSSYNNIQCFYHVFGERKDVDKLQVEYE